MKGLTEEHLEYLGKTGREAIKTSRRDLPIVLSQVRRETKRNMERTDITIQNRTRREPPRLPARCCWPEPRAFLSL